MQLRLLASRTAQLFAYRFDQPGPDLLGSGYPGAGFGSELVLLLGPTTTRQLAGRRFTAQEERLAAYVKRMWVDFARTGNPTPGARGYGVSWRRYTEADQGFLSLMRGGALLWGASCCAVSWWSCWGRRSWSQCSSARRMDPSCCGRAQS
ncbi:Carboxyl/Cholinesterase 42, partial [Frankliniella occidentalis]